MGSGKGRGKRGGRGNKEKCYCLGDTGEARNSHRVSHDPAASPGKIKKAKKPEATGRSRGGKDTGFGTSCCSENGMTTQMSEVRKRAEAWEYMCSLDSTHSSWRVELKWKKKWRQEEGKERENWENRRLDLALRKLIR